MTAEAQQNTEVLASEKPEVPSSGFFGWPFYVLHLTAFGLTLALYDLPLRLVRAISYNAYQRVVVAMCHSLLFCLRFLRSRVEILGGENIPPNGPLVIISNHQSLYDIPLLIAVFQKPGSRYIAKRELSHGLPSVSFHLRRGGNCIIDRDNPKQAIKAIGEFAKRANVEGFGTVIFPEGTRGRDGVLKPFRQAGPAKLLKTMPDCLVLPVTIEGSWKLRARREGQAPRGGLIQVVVGKPIPRGKESTNALVIAQAEKEISSTLSKLRSVHRS